MPPTTLRVHAALRKLEVLQDRAEPREFEEVQLAIMQQLGAPIQDLFAEFEPDARAAASLAQVTVQIGPEILTCLVRQMVDVCHAALTSSVCSFMLACEALNVCSQIPHLQTIIKSDNVAARQAGELCRCTRRSCGMDGKWR